mmetsp:Transcript_56100/g.159686  ORF Transcript_56100/g.159686 Transcript_56100/m.159686 type:complete len:308 (-) Transcript_56100:374-1297(-)
MSTNIHRCHDIHELLVSLEGLLQLRVRQDAIAIHVQLTEELLQAFCVRGALLPLDPRHRMDVVLPGLQRGVHYDREYQVQDGNGHRAVGEEKINVGLWVGLDHGHGDLTPAVLGHQVLGERDHRIEDRTEGARATGAAAVVHAGLGHRGVARVDEVHSKDGPDKDHHEHEHHAKEHDPEGPRQTLQHQPQHGEEKHQPQQTADAQEPDDLDPAEALCRGVDEQRHDPERRVANDDDKVHDVVQIPEKAPLENHQPREDLHDVDDPQCPLRRNRPLRHVLTARLAVGLDDEDGHAENYQARKESVEVV